MCYPWKYRLCPTGSRPEVTQKLILILRDARKRACFVRIHLLPVRYRFRESLKKFRRIHLVAFAVSLDRDGVEFGFGDNGDLSVEVDARIEF